MKTCSKCGKVKPSDQFGIRSKTAGTLRSACKDCTAVARRVYYAANKDRERASSRAWEEKNAAERSAYRKAYSRTQAAKDSRQRSYRKNLEANRAKKRQWHVTNAARSLANKRRWNAENAERIAAKRRVKYLATAEERRRAAREYARANRERRAYNQRRREARKRGNQHAVDPFFADYLAILKQDPCSYCGRETTTGDHIVPLASGGDHHWSNLTAACGPCNSSKRDIPLLIHLLRR